ncbi:MAG: alpha-mannosidase [Deinococcota bacterium]|nr:alpha-mannosidase [Deinococcota bacterium]
MTKTINKTTRAKLHMIGNAHIDPVWLWRWQEGFHEVKASFRSALDRLKEDDDFIFVSSSAVFYEWVERSDPRMFEEIRARVQEGRWEVVGGWWLQPDCNLPGGESFVRQALYGQRYFKEKFGVTAKVGYNVDSFGHHGMLPQLLKGAGLDHYVFMRPGPHELGLPGRLFWWVSDDGSKVLAFHLPFEYCTWGKDLGKHVRRCAGELREPVNELMCFYGVGNHGGGPTRENITSIKELSKDPDLPELVFSSPNRYFAAVTEKGWELPVVHRDLQHHASGCYAAHSGVKRWNRRAENLLMAAEKLATVAARVTGQPYPRDLEHAWKGILFNQFHDILAGTSLEEAYEDARDLYGEAMAIASRALNYAVQSLTWNVNVPEEEGVRPIVVFNPHAWGSRVPVELEIARIKEGEVLLDDEDKEVAMQTVQSEATANGRNRLLFVADLPPLGYRSYRVAPRPTEAGFLTLQANDNVLESGRFRLELDPETGFIHSLRDKAGGVEVFAGPAAKPVVVDDPSDTWSHNVYAFTGEVGAFKATSVRLVEHGPVRSAIRVTSAYGASTLVQDFRMYRELDLIEVKATVNWQERFKLLKLRFPVNVHFMRVTFDIPYGHIGRFANGEEEPGGTWVDLSGTSRGSGELYGFSLLNDSKYSFDVNVRDIGMTVLRSPIYAHHIPAEPREGEHYAFIDQGVQRFAYSLLPHAGGWSEAGTVRRAYELNQPPVALITTFHGGPLPQRASYLEVNNDNIAVSVLKEAEDGGGMVLRAYETSKNRSRATLRFLAWNREIHADFGPCEIKTWFVPFDEVKPVVETNLLEWAEAG